MTTHLDVTGILFFLGVLLVFVPVLDSGRWIPSRILRCTVAFSGLLHIVMALAVLFSRVIPRLPSS